MWGRAGLAALAVTLALFVPSGVAAEKVPVLKDSRLPMPLIPSGAFWFEGAAYIIGGWAGHYQASDQILRFDPESDTLTVAARLPMPLAMSAVAWTGRVAYIIGGSQPGTSTDDWRSEIWRYDPATGSISQVGRLPFPMHPGGAAWDGSAVYIFGGDSMYAADFDPVWGYSAAVFRFDPGSGIVTRVASRLPHGIMWTSSVWDGARIDLFVNSMHASGDSDIWRFNPGTGLVDIVYGGMPERSWWIPAVWTGNHAILLGGVAEIAGAIHRYVPGAAATTSTGVSLLVPSHHASAVWWGQGWCVFGGESYYMTSPLLDRIECLEEPKLVVVEPATVRAVATQVASNCHGSHVLFQAWTEDGVLNATWTFGDGESGTGHSLIHQYRSGGTYTVRAASSNASVAPATLTVHVTAPPPCPPGITAPPRQVVAQGEALRLCPSATAGMGGQLTLQATPLPPGATFDGACFSWMAAAGWNGCIQFSVLETPSGLTASDCTRVIVLQPPDAAIDRDRDGVADTADSCPATQNRDQLDEDGDGQGNACDVQRQEDPASDGGPQAALLGDRDGDGVTDRADNCRARPNPRQEDLDGDGSGNLCDHDLDGDGMAQLAAGPNDVTDNCPWQPNPGQEDADADGVGDACGPATSEAAAPVPAPAGVPVQAPGPGAGLAVLLGLLAWGRRRT